ncbi:MAG: succinate dehydrogenase assembly factor 2 [Gammaproteobacteria bacterium]|nr:succinate dehydrogenase assembly factor 2 [Gammaproteobacteria bacterium]MDH5801025.1 succinate dehydrogenase assembly factor 2 [Gammaproteobacteria bacterium]
MDQREKMSQLYWQCRRGMLELDTLLCGFYPGQYDDLSTAEQRCFEHLLQESDELLLEYLMGRVIPMDPMRASVVEKIRRSAFN